MKISILLVMTSLLAVIPPMASAKQCVAVIAGGTGRNFWHAIDMGAKKAGDELAIDIFSRELKVEVDSAGQSEMIHDALKKQCNAFVIAPNSSERVKEITELNQRRIPIVIMDRELPSAAMKQLPPSDHIYARVMTNNYQAGVQAATEMGRLLNGRGPVAVLSLKKGIPSTDAREQGFIDTANKAGLTVIDDIYLGTEIGEIRNNAAAFFYAQGDKIQGVFTPNENTSLGVLAELKRIKRAGKIVHIGFDYNDYLHDALTQGFITGLILQQPFEIGYRSVMQAQQAVRGVARPTEPIHTGTMYLHQGNMNSAATKTFLELNTAYGGTHPKSAP